MKWFKKFGLIYYPFTWQGVVISVIALSFLVHIFLFIVSRSLSTSDTLYGIFPYWVPTILGWLWIAERTS